MKEKFNWAKTEETKGETIELIKNWDTLKDDNGMNYMYYY